MRALLRLAAVVLTAAMACPGGGAYAQGVGIVQSDILVVDPERLFEETRLGQSIARKLQAERDALIARNRRIESELEAEERELTDLRPDTSPEDFRELADAFDTKVQTIRRDSERRVRELERNRERAPVDFMRQVEPVLVNVMREAGAVVVMDARSVLLRADVIDITDIVANRIDAVFPQPDGTVDNSGDSETDAPDAPAAEGGAEPDEPRE